MRLLMTIPENPASYVTWGWVEVSVPNLIGILVSVALIVLALLLPFPAGHDDDQDES